MNSSGVRDCLKSRETLIAPINRLTIVTNESYTDFVSGLQRDISDSLSSRPRIADEAFFTGKILETAEGKITVTPQIAKQIYKYLLKNDYTSDNDQISPEYHEAKEAGTLAPLPPELEKYSESVFSLVDSVFSEAQMPKIENELQERTNRLNDNFHKKEFQALWENINRKAHYTVQFDTDELVANCIAIFNSDEFQVTKLQYTLHHGEQKDHASYEMLKNGKAFETGQHSTEAFEHSVHSTVRYDLMGKLIANTSMTRKALVQILSGMTREKFNQFNGNPEDFIAKVCTVINEQKATQVIEYISYDPTEERYTSEIFTKPVTLSITPDGEPLKKHIYDYVQTDSKIERAFANELDSSDEVTVYAKLPKAFFIPTPVGNYNPDWAIAFEAGKVKHIYFIAETKGSLSSMELRKIEECKIACAKKSFLIRFQQRAKAK